MDLCNEKVFINVEVKMDIATMQKDKGTEATEVQNNHCIRWHLCMIMHAMQ